MPGLPETIPSALNEKSKIPDRDSVPSADAPIIVELMQKSELEDALVGIEPTGHYWFDLGQFMGSVILIEVRQLYFCLTRHYILKISLYFSSSKQPYSSSVTISSHSLEVSSPGHSIAR